jgi:hypothetical protein
MMSASDAGSVEAVIERQRRMLAESDDALSMLSTKECTSSGHGQSLTAARRFHFATIF